MHELSLAQALIAQLESLAQEHGAKSILKVKVRLGPFSGIVEDSFVFGFEAVSKASKLVQGATLEIDHAPKGDELTLLQVEME